MTTTFKQLAPCYLAVNRGFYCGPAALTGFQLETEVFSANSEAKLFTANIRRATTFSSFEEAETIFKILLGTRNRKVAINEYFAVLQAPVARIETPVEKLICGNCNSSNIRMVTIKGNTYYECIDCDSKCATQKAHPANCICPSCCDY